MHGNYIPRDTDKLVDTLNEITAELSEGPDILFETREEPNSNSTLSALTSVSKDSMPHENAPHVQQSKLTFPDNEDMVPPIPPRLNSKKCHYGSTETSTTRFSQVQLSISSATEKDMQAKVNALKASKRSITLSGPSKPTPPPLPPRPQADLKLKKKTSI
ncbi:hypothetical protein SK128_008560 [Halocaridina rubra]|uniref:Uncharacterized protein n=1 Tax=Halocaridina rubra TaxID=373956 RepID=A0AAN8WT39_HALRR